MFALLQSKVKRSIYDLVKHFVNFVKLGKITKWFLLF